MNFIINLNGGDSSIGIFIYKPGAVAPLPPRTYNNFATLYADAILHKGPVIIVIDDTMVHRLYQISPLAMQLGLG